MILSWLQWYRQTKGEDTVTDETYNGWPNWETWNANLWLTNDEGAYNYMIETVEGAANADDAGGRIKDAVLDLDDDGIKLIGDAMSLWRVEWAEIGRHFLETVRELEEG